jgi:hypothetical protein
LAKNWRQYATSTFVWLLSFSSGLDIIKSQHSSKPEALCVICFKPLLNMTDDSSFIIEDWWTDSQIKLVKDFSRIWLKKPFKSTSGFWTHIDEGWLLGKTSQHDQLPPDAITDDTAWDHQHCELCFETISDHGDYQHEGYTDGNEWLCANCYNKYLAPRQNKD